MAPALKLMDSFTRYDRFKWCDNAFIVLIPNGTRTSYHPRASVAQLKALLIPELRLTRAGNVSKVQPPPPPPKTYDFYLAQLIHYGLDFHFEIEAAKRALEIEIRLERLRVPSALQELEKELKREHIRNQKSIQGHPKGHTTKPQLQNAGKDILKDASYMDIAIHESIPTPATKLAKQKTLEDAANKSFLTGTPSSHQRNSYNVKERLGERKTKPDVVVETHDDTSTGSDGSLSAERTKRSAEEASRNNSALKSEDRSESSDGNSSIAETPVKRIRLEKAGKRNGSYTSATSVPRMQQRPSPQMARRRADSLSQAKVHRLSSTKKSAVDRSGIKGPTSPTNKESSKAPFVSPDRRPSWTIPVRSSPRIYEDSPKSVTFTENRPTTPSQVPRAKGEATSFSFGRSPNAQHKASSSPSPVGGQPGQPRSILKRGVIPGSTAATAANTAANPTDSNTPQITVNIPPLKDTGTATARVHTDRRNRQGEERENPALNGRFGLGGMDRASSPLTPSRDKKPYISSDLVNGAPITSQQKVAPTQGSPFYVDGNVDGNSSGRSGQQFVALNSRPTMLQKREERDLRSKIHMDRLERKDKKRKRRRDHSPAKADDEMSFWTSEGGREINQILQVTNGNLTPAGIHQPNSAALVVK